MAAAYVETGKKAGHRSISGYGVITLSGSYPAGGETLTGLVKLGTTKNPINVDLRHRAGASVTWNPATQKLQAWTAPNVEHTVAAYGASFTANVIDAEFEYPRGG